MNRDTPPLPRLRDALWLVRDAKAAIERALVAWNREQIHEALDDASKHLEMARAELGERK